jgi:hypothetical protein
MLLTDCYDQNSIKTSGMFNGFLLKIAGAKVEHINENRSYAYRYCLAMRDKL